MVLVDSFSFNWKTIKKNFFKCGFQRWDGPFWVETRRNAWLTLTWGLEAEGLEAASEGGGVDDINAVLALAPPIQGDSNDQEHDRHHACSQSWVQGHVAAALHTLKREWDTHPHPGVGLWAISPFLLNARLIGALGGIFCCTQLKSCSTKKHQLNWSRESFPQEAGLPWIGLTT